MPKSTASETVLIKGSPRIWLVDDEPSFREAMKRLFRSADFTFESFANGQAFLDTFEDQENSCVLLDLRMPVLGGLEILRTLRANECDVPVIVYTGHADVPVTVRAMQDKAYCVLEKPMSPELLVSTVREAITKTALQRSQNAQIRSARQRIARLSEREREIAELLVSGQTAKVIANHLGLSRRTVETHRGNILRKLELSSLVELAGAMLRSKLHCA